VNDMQPGEVSRCPQELCLCQLCALAICMSARIELVSWFCKLGGIATLTSFDVAATTTGTLHRLWLPCSCSPVTICFEMTHSQGKLQVHSICSQLLHRLRAVRARIAVLGTHSHQKLSPTSRPVCKWLQVDRHSPCSPDCAAQAKA